MHPPSSKPPFPCFVKCSTCINPENIVLHITMAVLLQKFRLFLFGKLSLNNLYCPLLSQSIPTWYIPPGNPRGLAQKDCPGVRDLTFESCPGAGNSTRTGILWKLKLKRFVRLLVLLVINRGCIKNC